VGPRCAAGVGLEGRAAPQGAGLVGPAAGRRASLVPRSRPVGRLHPRAGEPDDFRQAPLGEEARRIAETLLSSGPLPTAVLRQAVGLQGRCGGVRFSAAVVQLGRTLVCTSVGTEQVGAGWPSVVLELTARAFDLGGRDPDEAARRLRVGRRFLDTMLEASARELAVVFGWPPAAAHAALGALVDRGEAVLEAGTYRPGL
jgi:hypothetical protein